MYHLRIIEKLKREHTEIFDNLDMLKSIPEMEGINVIDSTVSKLGEIYTLWNKHEKEEEKFFEKLDNNFPVKKMEIAHEQIRGHYKVLLLAIETKNKEKIRLAIELDGEMFANKLKKHMQYEEKLFEKYFR